MKFRKKPVVIEAFQVGSERFYPDWLHDAVTANIVITHAAPNNNGWGEAFDNCDITTLEGVMHVQRGDWIIRSVKGELYPCNPDIFALTYEPADSPAIPSLTDAAPMTVVEIMREWLAANGSVVDFTRSIEKAAIERMKGGGDE